jgi:hypothetical protein
LFHLLPPSFRFFRSNKCYNKLPPEVHFRRSTTLFLKKEGKTDPEAPRCNLLVRASMFWRVLQRRDKHATAATEMQQSCNSSLSLYVLHLARRAEPKSFTVNSDACEKTCFLLPLAIAHT